MSTEKVEDIRDTALKLIAIYTHSPTDYAYLKGWINCLMQKEDSNQTNKKHLSIRHNT